MAKLMNFHDESGKQKTTVLHYRYSPEPFDDDSVIKLHKRQESYKPEIDYYLYMGSLNWKITAKVSFETFIERAWIMIPHCRLMSYVGSHNAYVSNPRTPNIQWHVDMKDEFTLYNSEVRVTGGFDIWLTFEPHYETKQKMDEWDVPDE